MKVAIVGASGAVGQEFLRVLDQQNFPIEELKLFGSTRSAGSSIVFRGKNHTIQLLRDEPEDFAGIDVAFVSAGAGVSRQYAETITARGALMIDNSSAFRMAPMSPWSFPKSTVQMPLTHRVTSSPTPTARQYRWWWHSIPSMHCHPSNRYTSPPIRQPAAPEHRLWPSSSISTAR